MVAGKENMNFILCLTRQDLTDLLKRFSRYYNLFIRIGILYFNISDGDPVSVQRYDFKFIVMDLEQLSRHQFVVVIVRNGEDRLTDHFF